jgi:hypothetical protein
MCIRVHLIETRVFNLRYSLHNTVSNPIGPNFIFLVFMDCFSFGNLLSPWLESASELYRPSDRRLSAKLMPTFADIGVSHGQCGGSPTTVISVF